MKVLLLVALCALWTLTIAQDLTDIGIFDFNDLDMLDTNGDGPDTTDTPQTVGTGTTTDGTPKEQVKTPDTTSTGGSNGGTARTDGSNGGTASTDGSNGGAESTDGSNGRAESTDGSNGGAESVDGSLSSQRRSVETEKSEGVSPALVYVTPPTVRSLHTGNKPTVPVRKLRTRPYRPSPYFPPYNYYDSPFFRQLMYYYYMKELFDFDVFEMFEF